MERYIDIHTHLQTEALTIRCVGLHPWHTATGKIPLREELSDADAVGEIGLDKACGVDFELQKRCFEAQLKLAVEGQKPVVLHTVRAFEEVMTTLKQYPLRAVIFHGFIGSREQAERALRAGYYLSFGARTAASPKSIEALRATPLDRLFVESDEDPTPIEKRYEEVAALRGVTIAQLRTSVAQNYERIFCR